VIGHAQQLEPECAELRQNPPLIGNSLRHHPVERADPIRRDEQQAVAQVIHIADLAAADGDAGQTGFE
jgi:hypothetical protein